MNENTRAQTSSPSTLRRPMATVLKATSLLLTLAAGGSAVANSFKQVQVNDCDMWSSSEFRCLANDEQRPTTRVLITNRTQDTLTFKYDEWHSRCGNWGGRVHAMTYTIPANGTLDFDMLAPGKDSYNQTITCREGFIYQCNKASGGSVNCPQALYVKRAYYVGNLQ